MRKFKETYTVIALLLTTVFFTSCNEDFNTLDSSIDIGDNFETSLQKYNVKAYTKKLGPVQTNNLPINLLGVYSDGYGKTTANVVNQLTLGAFDPNFPCGASFDSIVLNIPYFSTIEDTDEDGNTTFTLDSIFGESPIKLSVFKNNYFLRDFVVDGEFNENLAYFSNYTTSENTPLNVSDLEGDLLYEDLSFTPDARQIKFLDEDGDVTSRANPAIRIRLDDFTEQNDPDVNIMQPASFWEDLFLSKEGEPELSNMNNFNNYFRGIYIKPIDNTGELLMLLNMGSATIEMYYTVKDDDGDGIPDFADVDFDCDQDGIPDFADADINGDGEIDNGTDTDGDGINNDTDADVDGNGQIDDGIIDSNGNGINDAEEDPDEDGIHTSADIDNGEGEDNNANGIVDSVEDANSSSFVLNFTGNRVNFLDNQFTINDGNADDGDNTLFLKGGDGSIAVIELFDENFEDNSVQDFIDDFRGDDIESPKRLINEAFLNFYVDQSMIQGEEPDRIYIFDIKNEVPIIDYFVDQSFANTPFESKPIHLPPLERVGGDTDGQGIRYRVRVTEHLNNIILRDSSNVKLGLAVSKSVAIESDTTVRFSVDSDDEDFDYIPLSAILSPRGTVLYGSTQEVPEDKRIELEVYYTEPDFN